MRSRMDGIRVCSSSFMVAGFRGGYRQGEVREYHNNCRRKDGPCSYEVLRSVAAAVVVVVVMVKDFGGDDERIEGAVGVRLSPRYPLMRQPLIGSAIFSVCWP